MENPAKPTVMAKQAEIAPPAPELPEETYQSAVDSALRLTDGLYPEDSGNPDRGLVRMALTYALAQAKLIRPIVADAVELKKWAVPYGGPEDNPYLQIDKVGSELAEKMLHMPQFVKLPLNGVYMEERGWLTAPQNPPAGGEGGPQWNGRDAAPGDKPDGNFLIIDPVDASKSLVVGRKMPVTGIVILDQSGNLKTGSIVSHVDRRLLFYDGKEARYYDFDDAGNTVTARSTNRHGGCPELEDVKFATHARRIESHPDLVLWQKGRHELERIGGFAVLEILDGNIHTCVDPRGQPAQDELFSAGIAEAAGLEVSDTEGKPIDYGLILTELRRGVQHRIPYAISCNRDVHLQTLNSLMAIVPAANQTSK
ncbi:hypothetical protein A2Z33_01845 [Candidatus Gottesmanbacteria bacterium RBG_16_52_11]|uniref:Inositol monophosphatase n=1 Tax=Candidatus Gottesmanbacteria bacterium RBG_16_52_11 TaxID=1798374 RepID=A0A1F5YQQ7_9BACT|nr:MAG: hypothetical protein A2Z33_01845 [Candidatus Gottesmanbacteria bacterium RBG_16_52_11]